MNMIYGNIRGILFYYFIIFLYYYAERETYLRVEKRKMNDSWEYYCDIILLFYWIILSEYCAGRRHIFIYRKKNIFSR